MSADTHAEYQVEQTETNIAAAQKDCTPSKPPWGLSLVPARHFKTNPVFFADQKLQSMHCLL